MTFLIDYFKRFLARLNARGAVTYGKARPAGAVAGSNLETHRSNAQNATAEDLAAKNRGQAMALAALASIDRAILSRVDTNHVMRLVLKDVRAVIACEALAITLLPTSKRPQCLTLLTTTDRLLEHRPDLDPATLGFLTSHLNGWQVDDCAKYALLAPLVEIGIRNILLLPILVDASLAAVLALGLSGENALPREQHTYARDFADRLGVALTAGSRDLSLYGEGQYDLATALPNRRFLAQRIAEEISRAQRADSRFALLQIGLDKLRTVNEISGYRGGDEVLQEAARRLKESLREQDILARCDGDHFVALLPAIPDTVGPGKAAAKLIGVLSQPFTVGGQDHHLTACIGVCVYPEDGRSAEKLLRSADVAMTRAKAGGSGQYVFFEERIDARISERVALERDLKQAIGDNQLTIVYQPQIELRTGRMASVEALVRWRHPKRGLIPPGEFIGIAEQSNLIDQIGEYVRQTACQQYRLWTEQGLAPERIAVNVSSREIRRKDFLENIERILRETGMRPFCLELEITESMLIEDSAHVLGMLKRIHDRGVRISIDDFGTGYSCLGYLKQLPFDVLKIDRTFVTGIGTGDGSDAIFNAIVGMAHSLGKEVVAEGVETEQQRLFVANNGCELGQGFLWGQPKSAEDLVLAVRGEIGSAQLL